MVPCDRSEWALEVRANQTFELPRDHLQSIAFHIRQAGLVRGVTQGPELLRPRQAELSGELEFPAFDQFDLATGGSDVLMIANKVRRELLFAE